MSTLAELGRLAGRTLAVWLRCWPQLAGWWSLGWAVQLVTLLASVWLGRYSSELALVVFILGPLGLVAGTVLALHSTAPQLEHQLRLGRRSRRQVLATSLPAVLGVYALWGLTDEAVGRLFALNYVLYGLSTEAWSVNLTRVWSYAALAVVAWVARRAVGLLPAGRGLRAWLAVVLEPLWVFASFLAVAAAAGEVVGWWRTRAVAVAARQAWLDFLAWLPDWSWWGLALPDAIAGVVDLLWTVVVPGFLGVVLLPLVWLALTALVLGWDDFADRPVAEGEAAARLAAAAGAGWRRLGPLRRPLAALATDWREKYLPVLHALRLVWRTGPDFMAAYLLLTAVLGSLGRWAEVGVRSLLPDWDNPAEVGFGFVWGLGHGLVFTTALLAAYAVGLDRCLAAQPVTTSSVSPPNQRSSPSAAAETVTSATTSPASAAGTVTE